VDRGHNAFHVTAFGQFDLSAVQGNGGVGFQLGLSGPGGQTQFAQQAFVSIYVCQLNGSTSSRSQGQATGIKFCGNGPTSCIPNFGGNFGEGILFSDSNSEAINGDIAIQTGNIVAGCCTQSD